MKKVITFALLLCAYTLAAEAAFGQQTCDFSIIGTWQVAAPGNSSLPVYRYTTNGQVRVLAPSGDAQDKQAKEIAVATFALDNPAAPGEITFTSNQHNTVFSHGKSVLKITGFDDLSFTWESPASAPIRWVRVDSDRYYLILAARLGVFYDRSGPAFPMLVWVAGRDVQVDAFGTYAINGVRSFGSVPVETSKEFMKEQKGDSDVMLRLQITPAQYERGMAIFRTWERRVREDALLYQRNSYLNNILFVKEVTESLNQCGEKVKMYKLNYLIDDDWITEKYGSPFVPFNYFKELRRLNETLHIRDDQFTKPS